MVPGTLRDQLHGLIDRAVPDEAPALPGDVTLWDALFALASTTDPEHADLLALAHPRPADGDRLAERVGPCYRTAQLVRLLPESGQPITDEAVRARRRSGSLIGLRTRDRRWVYPAWQFRVRPGRLVVRDDVFDLWALLGTADDPWSRAAWMGGRRRDLDGHSPLAWLQVHGLDERLRVAAGDRRRRAAA